MNITQSNLSCLVILCFVCWYVACLTIPSTALGLYLFMPFAILSQFFLLEINFSQFKSYHHK